MTLDRTVITEWGDIIGKYGVNAILLGGVLFGGWDLANKYLSQLSAQTLVMKQTMDAMSEPMRLFTSPHNAQAQPVIKIAETMQQEKARYMTDRNRLERESNLWKDGGQ